MSDLVNVPGAEGLRSEEGPPRIEPLPREDWDELLLALLSRSLGGAERPLNIFTTLARHPELFRRWLGFGGALLAGKLSARQRELVILRTAHHCGSAYEWAQHVSLAKAAGVADQEIEALRGAISPGDWEASDLLMLRAADELDSQGTISDPTWEALAERLDDASLIELVMLVGQYRLVAMTIRTLRIQLEEP